MLWYILKDSTTRQKKACLPNHVIWATLAHFLYFLTFSLSTLNSIHLTVIIFRCKELNAQVHEKGSNQQELTLGSSHLIFIFCAGFHTSHVEILERSSVFISSLCRKLCLHFLHTYETIIFSPKYPVRPHELSCYTPSKSVYVCISLCAMLECTMHPFIWWTIVWRHYWVFNVYWWRGKYSCIHCAQLRISIVL